MTSSWIVDSTLSKFGTVHADTKDAEMHSVNE